MFVVYYKDTTSNRWHYAGREKCQNKAQTLADYLQSLLDVVSTRVVPVSNNGLMG